MFVGTLQMINNFIIDIKCNRDTAQPVIFPGLLDNKDLLTGLCHEQEGLYAAFLESTRRMQQIRQQHWANKNFNKAKVMGLDTYYHVSIEIMNDN